MIRGAGSAVTAELSFTAQTSGTVRLDFAARTRGTLGFDTLVLGNAAITTFANVMFDSYNGVVQYYQQGVGWTVIGGLSWTHGVWHDVAVEMDLGTTTARVGIDGGALATFSTYGTPTSVDFLRYDTNKNTTWDIDAIPEPATLAVLALGGIAALLRRRR